MSNNDLKNIQARIKELEQELKTERIKSKKSMESLNSYVFEGGNTYNEATTEKRVIIFKNSDEFNLLYGLLKHHSYIKSKDGELAKEILNEWNKL